MASNPALELAETIQTASINRAPSPTHDLNPSTAASERKPVKASHAPAADSSADKYVYDDEDESAARSEEHTSELQSQSNLVCRLLLEKKNTSLHHAALPPARTSRAPPRLALSWRRRAQLCADSLQPRNFESDAREGTSTSRCWPRGSR